jgi:prepilin-type N-terminal cleavage/methylation domain-containing protein
MNWHLLRLILAKAKYPKGLTLIESLVAIVVVSVLLAFTAPLIVVSAAIRIQARRMEQAVQAGRGFIDSTIATGRASYTIKAIDAYSALIVPSDGSCPTQTYGGGVTSSAPAPYSFSCVLAPGGSGVSIADLNKIPGIKVDTDRDGFNVLDVQDYVIQPMINRNIVSILGDSTKLEEKSFTIGVRVYRAEAFTQDANGNLIGTWDGNPLLTGDERDASGNPICTIQVGGISNNNQSGGAVTTFVRRSCPLSVQIGDVLRKE